MTTSPAGPTLIAPSLLAFNEDKVVRTGKLVDLSVRMIVNNGPCSDCEIIKKTALAGYKHHIKVNDV